MNKQILHYLLDIDTALPDEIEAIKQANIVIADGYTVDFNQIDWD